MLNIVVLVRNKIKFYILLTLINAVKELQHQSLEIKEHFYYYFVVPDSL